MIIRTDDDLYSTHTKDTDLNEYNDFMLKHSGTPHEGNTPHSGRYPWGSGENPNQHEEARRWLDRVDKLKKKKFTYTDMRKTVTDNKGNRIPNKDYGKTFVGTTAIAKHMGIPTKEFKAYYSIAYNQKEIEEYQRIMYLKDHEHLGATEIGRRMNMSEGTVRSKINSELKARVDKSEEVYNYVKARVDQLGMVQCGKGVEAELGVTRTKLDAALTHLYADGYETFSARVPQTTDTTKSRQSTFKVIAPPGTEHKDLYNYGEVHSMTDYISKDNGKTFEKKGFQYPASCNPSRVKVRYAEEGGTEKDGLVELRPGCPDLSLGEDRYSQVRILVGKDKYVKGMAIYGDPKDFPDGVDVIYNSHHSKDEDYPNLKPVKRLKNGEIDKENPFGSAIKEEGGQYTYVDEKGKTKLGLINKRAEEGDWNEWGNKLPSQFLAKQDPSLIKKQLTLTADIKKDELNDILNLENPTVKKKLLSSYAEDTDSVAVHLKAASLPRQRYQVLLPVPEMPENQIFAPNYKNGEKVALVRFPHGGTFEIPICVVNNNQPQAVKRIGKEAQDVIGVNSKVASKLSGADFDGDTAMVIPIGKGIKINSKESLPGLKGLDTEALFGPDYNKSYKDKNGNDHWINNQGKEYNIMANTQTQMGVITNLITDMHVIGARDDEIERAVAYSMVVIDAAKHKLDYKSAEAKYRIPELHEKFQGKKTGGAATVISKAKSKQNVPKRQGSPKINIKGTDYYDPSKPEGALLWKENPNNDYLYVNTPNGKINARGKEGTRQATVYERDGKYYYNKSNDKNKKEYVQVKDPSKIKVGHRTQESTKMMEKYDAYELLSNSGSEAEKLYADFANEMKSLANKARIELTKVRDIPYSREASKTYEGEVKYLREELLKAEKNAPRERQALLISNSRVEAKLKEYNDLDKEEEKKLRQKELTKARNEVGAHRYNVKLTDKSWEAIQAGAISPTLLSRILNHVEIDAVKERATPRTKVGISDAMAARAKAMSKNGYTAAQIAEELGISVTSVYDCINPKKK